MTPAGVLSHNSALRERHDFKLTALTPSDSGAETSRGEIKDRHR